MRRIKSATLIALVMAAAAPIWAEYLATVRDALKAKYALTTTTAHKADIVTPGVVLVLKKSNLLMVGVGSKIVFTNTYSNGEISQNVLSKAKSWLKVIPGVGLLTTGSSERIFVRGEALWVVDIEGRENAIVFDLLSDPYSGIRYGATLTFPLQNASNPSLAHVLKTVAEAFSIQGSNDAKTVQQTWQAPAEKRTVKQVAEAPPPPIAPPPPPSADPKTVSAGQTVQQVVAAFGQPNKILKPAANKEIYVYSDTRVTFVNGKVADLQ